jgi:hypothetical protein
VSNSHLKCAKGGSRRDLFWSEQVDDGVLNGIVVDCMLGSPLVVDSALASCLYQMQGPACTRSLTGGTFQNTMLVVLTSSWVKAKGRYSSRPLGRAVRWTGHVILLQSARGIITGDGVISHGERSHRTLNLVGVINFSVWLSPNYGSSTTRAVVRGPAHWKKQDNLFENSGREV